MYIEMFIRILQDLQIRTQKIKTINYSNDTAQQVVKEAV
jgi:hypothetical protein